MRALDRRLPTIAAMERAAARRVPRFVFDFVRGGIGVEACLAANRRALDEVLLVPRYLPAEPVTPRLETTLFSRRYPLPFAPSSVGASGLLWPRGAERIAASARRAGAPVLLSSLATSSIEDIAAIAGDDLWFQLYCSREPEIENELIDRGPRPRLPGPDGDRRRAGTDATGTRHRQRLFRAASLRPFERDRHGAAARLGPAAMIRAGRAAIPQHRTSSAPAAAARRGVPVRLGGHRRPCHRRQARPDPGTLARPPDPQGHSGPGGRGVVQGARCRRPGGLQSRRAPARCRPDGPRRPARDQRRRRTGHAAPRGWRRGARVSTWRG